MEVKRAYVELEAPIVLRGRTKKGENLKVTLPKGERVRLLGLAEGDRQTPYICQHDSWGSVFRLGRPHRVVTVLEELVVDGESTATG